MEYRTKAAIKIIAQLTKEEAFELFNLVDSVGKMFSESRLRLQSLDKESAVAFACETMDSWIADGVLEVPEYLADSLNSFLKLMVSERAQEDELSFEYNRALCPLLQYDLFKANP